MSEEQQRVTDYTAILRFVGCSATAPEAAQMGAGDDPSFNHAFVMFDTSDAKDAEQALDPRADPRIRREVIRSLVAYLSQVVQAAVLHCAQAVTLRPREHASLGVPLVRR